MTRINGLSFFFPQVTYSLAPQLESAAHSLDSFTSSASEAAPPSPAQFRQDLHQKALEADVTQLRTELSRTIDMGFVSRPAARKDNLIGLFREKSPQDREELVRGLESQGTNLSDELSRHFEGAELAEVKAIVKQGRLTPADEVYQAVETSDSEDVRISRALERKTVSQVQSMREEYREKYGKDMDAHIAGGLSGASLERAQKLLRGVPEAEEGTAERGAYIADLLQGDLDGERQPVTGIPMVQTRQLLDDLHGWKPEDLKAAQASYAQKTGESLEEVLRDRLQGSDEKMALAYLNDGHEDAQEKLLRAVTGKNDMELIRDTLGSSDEATRQGIRSNFALMERMKDDLTSTQLSEFEGLLDDGRLDARDKVAVAVADGGDQRILDSLVGLSAEDRGRISKDTLLQAGLQDKLDSDNFETAKNLLAGGRDPLERRLDKLEKTKDVYALVADATPEERTELAKQDWTPWYFKGLDKDRMGYLLEHGAQTCQDKILSAGDEKDILKALRQADAPELKAAAADPQVQERIQDLDDRQLLEAKARLSGEPVSMTQSLHFALEQKDGARAVELLENSSHPAGEVADSYAASFGQDLKLALQENLKRDDYRRAEAALRAPASDNQQLQDRVGRDLHEDRDDQEVFAQASNHILDAFNDSGRNMDDAAREARDGQSSDPGQVEETFQARRQEMHVAKAKLADTVATVAGGLIATLATGGAGGGLLGVMVTGCEAGAAQLVLEKTLRGNDLSLSEEGLDKFGKGFVAGSASKVAEFISPGLTGLSKVETVARKGAGAGVEKVLNRSYAMATGAENADSSEWIGNTFLAYGAGGIVGKSLAALSQSKVLALVGKGAELGVGKGLDLVL